MEKWHWRKCFDAKKKETLEEIKIMIYRNREYHFDTQQNLFVCVFPFL